MAEADKVVFAFTTGLVAPLYEGRVDVEKLATGCRNLENMKLGEYGYAERRAGSQFIALTKESEPGSGS